MQTNLTGDTNMHLLKWLKSHTHTDTQTHTLQSAGADVELLEPSDIAEVNAKSWINLAHMFAVSSIFKPVLTLWSSSPNPGYLTQKIDWKAMFTKKPVCKCLWQVYAYFTKVETTQMPFNRRMDKTHHGISIQLNWVNC